MHPAQWPDDAEGWKRYATYLKFCAADAGAARELYRERMSRGWCIGSTEFEQRMRDEAKQRGLDFQVARFAGVESSEVCKERRSVWEDRRVQLALLAQMDLQTLTRKNRI